MEYTIHRFDTLDSTNNQAIRLAEEGAPEGTVVVARKQTAGRGRRGRSWSSPAGCGLYLSLVLRPKKPSGELWQIAFLAAVAVAKTVEQVSGLPAQIKWPNDVLLNGRKISGILIESRSGNSPTVIAGIGINVNTLAFPPEIAESATSIAAESASAGGSEFFDLHDVEKTLLDTLSSEYAIYLTTGFTPIFDTWRDLDCTVGRRIAVNTRDGVTHGIAIGIDESGNLELERDDGSRVHFPSGEVLLEG